MMENEEIINPEEWTQKELVKHLYREIKEIKSSQKEILDSMSTEHTTMKSRIKKLEDDLQRSKGFVAATVVIINIIAWCIGLAIDYFKD